MRDTKLRPLGFDFAMMKKKREDVFFSEEVEYLIEMNKL